jgi:hypothetical protein
MTAGPLYTRDRDTAGRLADLEERVRRLESGSLFVGMMAVKGWTQTGPPVMGTYTQGQFGFDAVGTLYWCSASGTPGTWITA